MSFSVTSFLKPFRYLLWQIQPDNTGICNINQIQVCACLFLIKAITIFWILEYKALVGNSGKKLRKILASKTPGETAAHYKTGGIYLGIFQGQQKQAFAHNPTKKQRELGDQVFQHPWQSPHCCPNGNTTKHAWLFKFKKLNFYYMSINTRFQKPTNVTLKHTKHSQEKRDRVKSRMGTTHVPSVQDGRSATSFSLLTQTFKFLLGKREFFFF